MENRKFAKKDSGFGKACVIANCKTTTRQASKYRMKKGIAWGASHPPYLNPLVKGMPGFEDYSE